MSRALRQKYVAAAGDAAADATEALAAWALLDEMLLAPAEATERARRAPAVRTQVAAWAYECFPLVKGAEASVDSLTRAEMLLLRGRAKEAAHVLRATPPFALAGRDDAVFLAALKALTALLDETPGVAGPGTENAANVVDDGDDDDEAEELSPAEWMEFRERVSDVRAKHPTELGSPRTSSSRGKTTASSGPSLAGLCAILQGDLGAISAAMLRHGSRGASWPHLLAATTLFHAPTLQRHQLGELAESCAAQWPDARVRGSVIAAAKRDVVGVLQLFRAEIGDAWVEAHIADVYARAGVLECAAPLQAPPTSFSSSSELTATRARRSARAGSSRTGGVPTKSRTTTRSSHPALLLPLELDVREAAFVRFACQTALRPHASVEDWALAVDYLSALTRPLPGALGTVGRAWTEAILSRADAGASDAAAHALTTMGERLGWPELAASAARQRARVCFRTGGMMRTALEWATHLGPEEVNRLVASLVAADDAAMRDDASAARKLEDLWSLIAAPHHPSGSGSAMTMADDVMDDLPPAVEAALPASAATLLRGLGRVHRMLRRARADLEAGRPEWVFARDLAVKETVALFESPSQTTADAFPARLRVALVREVLVDVARGLSPAASERARRNPARLTVSQCLSLLSVVEAASLSVAVGSASLVPPVMHVVDPATDAVRVVLVSCLGSAVEGNRWRSSGASLSSSSSLS